MISFNCLPVYPVFGGGVPCLATQMVAPLRSMPAFVAISPHAINMQTANVVPS